MEGSQRALKHSESTWPLGELEDTRRALEHLKYCDTWALKALRHLGTLGTLFSRLKKIQYRSLVYKLKLKVFIERHRKLDSGNSDTDNFFKKRDSLQAKMNSQYNVWSYKKNKHKKIKAYRKVCLENTYN